jgi:2-phospho-L-lactate/phosphoenolpyruvate guanylyltransferase
MPDVSGDGDEWSLLVPVKRLAIAKTRLVLADDRRAAIALAMACDTVSAALAAAAVAEVVVVTDDPRARDALSDIGARVVADRPNAGLNPALTHGASMAATPRVAALSSDLPALRSAELDAVLALAAAHEQAVVADVSGSGTTLLTALVVAAFSPAFGPGSLAAHVGAGAIDLSPLAGPSVRHDVDTLAGLDAAVDLGLGPATAALLAHS